MTEKELKQYRSLLKEAEGLQAIIEKLYDKEVPTSHSTVRASAKKFPFIEYHIGVWVEDPKQAATRDKLITMYEDRYNKAEAQLFLIERFIGNIPDSDMRQIFEYRYIDGFTLREIGDKMSRDWSGIGKKIRDYFNFPTIPQNQ